MAEIAHWFNFIVSLVSAPCLALTGVFFYRKKRSYPRLMMACGLIFIFLAMIVQYYSPRASITYEQFKNIISSEGPRLSWYYGSLLNSFGLIVTVVGFAIETFKKTDIE